MVLNLAGDSGLETIPMLEARLKREIIAAFYMGYKQQSCLKDK